MVGCEWGDALLMVQDRNYGDDEEVGGKRGGKRRLMLRAACLNGRRQWLKWFCEAGGLT